ncbi:MAG: response regulator [Dysgonamonadaceae bacterium]|jgi:signal transduction histidine kinase/ligand-binding sensor domain-containing protein/CheY-like chemotaxis protein|nr:response regulator [Dysgonamonadaceae bacterium]
MKRHKRLLEILFFLSSVYLSQGQNTAYQSFENIALSAEATAVNCFAQDYQGLMWIGSNRGLYSYDGFSTQAHTSDRTNTQVYCLLILNETYLCLGTDNGLFFYNYRTDRYENAATEFPADVRALALCDSVLWIGSLNGLFCYNFRNRKLENIPATKTSGLPHETIYSIIQAGHTLYVGTYNGFCKYLPDRGTFEKIALPSDAKRSNQFVNVLLEDTLRKCIWIGTEGMLYKYIPNQNRVESFDHFRDNSVKSLAIDRSVETQTEVSIGAQKLGPLLVGTDNGLYVYNETNNSVQHIVHDSRNDKSLSNNIIWNIFSDREKNVWMGTDYNISLARRNQAFQLIPISQITGKGDGNRFHALFRDSRGNFWLGGTNGLIFSPSLNTPNAAIWYRMGDAQYPISHNRIRQIYEDKDRHLWIASDGSISRYDYDRKQFIHYTIIDSTHTYNSNWAYHLFEDDRKRLWIATCLGGIFVVDKCRLMQSQGTYIAEQNYTVQNGLSGSFVNQILPDKNGNVWVLFYKNGINKIIPDENKIIKIPIANRPENDTPHYMMRDDNGFIWAGFRDGLVRINPDNHQSQFIKFNTFANSEILSMTEERKRIWISTTDGVWIVDKQTAEIQSLNIPNKLFTAGFYDPAANVIYLGASDELAFFSPSLQKKEETTRPVILTALYVNGKQHHPENLSVRYMNEIQLNYDQNNLNFEFSDLRYASGQGNKFVYQLEGVDNTWNMLRQQTNHISCQKLKYGKYRLIINKLDLSGNPSATPSAFAIHIMPPWYYTFLAKCIYILLIAGLFVWIFNFFRVRNNLRIERIEKEKTLELANLKIDFFTNLSHEFKTPLSLIIAPVSKLLQAVKDPAKKKQLETVQQNALKINSLIRQVIDFNRSDTVNPGLILSKVEFVAFARSLFSTYEEGYKEKDLTFRFTANKEKIYLLADILKMEAVLNNLLTNACKYSEAGVVSLCIACREDEKQLAITVEDTGIGIPDREIAYVFKRFYQSSKTAKDKEGTGIGLYLVKTYTEQHQGTVNIQSEENKGTIITVTLPLREETEASNNLPLVSGNADSPLILIVDDNPEIADFIHKALAPGYRCEIACNGKQGLEKCLHFHPDLIIADIMMPVMNGLEMTRRIRKQLPASTIPIILLTAKDDKDTELESMHLNVNAFIPKPFEMEILLSRIEQLLRQEQLMQHKLRMEALTQPKTVEITDPDEKFLSEITNIIEERMDDPALSVNALSRFSGTGAKQIYRKIKQLTGLPPVEYIRSIRMKKAAILLSQKKFTVSEVMYMVGFSSHSYFSKCFQAEFGKTPGKYADENHLSG